MLVLEHLQINFGKPLQCFHMELLQDIPWYIRIPFHLLMQYICKATAYLGPPQAALMKRGAPKLLNKQAIKIQQKFNLLIVYVH